MAMTLVEINRGEYEFCIHEGWSGIFREHGDHLNMAELAFSRHRGFWCFSAALLGLRVYLCRSYEPG